MTDRIALTGGQWRPRKDGVLVWVRNAVTMTSDEWRRSGQDGPRIGCGQCGALVTETCRTRNGHRTTNHIGRLPRECDCGALLGGKRTKCDDCTTTWKPKRVAA